MSESLQQSFGQRLASYASDCPNHIAVRCDEDALAYQSLAAEAAQLANVVIRMGLAPGRAPRIGVLATNSVEYAIVVATCYAYGFCLVPIPSLIAPDAQARMLVDAEVGILFVSDNLQHKAREALSLAATSGKRTAVIALDFVDSQWPTLSEVLSVEEPFFAAGFALPEWEANIIYSSGTTGVPKGIAHTHHARGVQFENIGALGFSTETQLIDTVSLYSNFGVSGLTATLYWGGTTLMMSKFSVTAMVGFYESYEPSVAWVVPAVLLRALADPAFESAVEATHTLKVCSGAPLNPAQKQECLLKWPGKFIEMYGQTETGIVTALEVNDAPPDKLGSVGRVLRNCVVAIVGEDRRPLEADAVGEVAAHTPDLMSDYHGRAQGDSRIFWHDCDGRRFKLTGDLGRLDAEGYLWLSGRAGDTIISGGYNVYAVDIEAALADHPAVLEVAVVGAPSRKWGETPVACVQLRDGAKVDADELRCWANARLGEIQRLAGVEVYAELPRGSMGKILKRQLREELASRGDDYQQARCRDNVTSSAGLD
jgi:acyl-CoA synthetase (AMP-forming)/AMP-acid ligase II